ncbi:MAG: DUF4424 domain-containing protein [Bdellovibrionales bacterium]|nr:DUF4424 domain-containing protein [Bdellovibrionales bacterium]
MTKKVTLFSFFFCFLQCSMALSNDTLATIETSGLVFKKSRQISMETEDLFISLDNIRVDYTFKNAGLRPVTSLVTFPLPDLELQTPHSINLEKNLKNPLSFELKVNGLSLPVKPDVKINDRTQIMKLNYFWSQTFPARKSIRVEHNYLTGAGSGFPEQAQEIYCFDQSFKDSLKSLEADLLKKYQASVRDQKMYGTFENHYKVWLHYHTRRVDYILKTGANWKGPIKNFKLTVDKGRAENLISFCWDGPRDLSNTQITAIKTDFKPAKDLRILIVDTSSMASD